MNRGKKPANTGSGSPVRKGGEDVTAAKIEREMVDALEAIGAPPRFIYAYQQAGVLVTEENFDQVDDAARRDWTAAIERYDALHAA